MPFALKRIYEAPTAEDGFRVLVERLWPRGVSKQKAALDLWLKDVAPSPELRRWFAHDPEKWVGFRARYHSELEGKHRHLEPLVEMAMGGAVTLLFSSREEKHNNAVALKAYLDALSRGRRLDHARL